MTTSTTIDTALDAAAPEAPEAPEPDLRRLRARLARRADEEGLLDVGYRTIDTQVGRLLLAATPAGLVRVAFDGEGHDRVLQTIADAISPRVLSAPARLDPIARQIDEYLSGRRRRFAVTLDWQLAHGFRRTVLGHLATDVGYGHTASYTALAEWSGRPKAVRAVGTACATNPIPLVVPCHRVIRADGSLGHYRGGADAKRTLLDLEAAR